MSIVKAIKHQLGLSVTPANNFLLDASANNGTMKLARESGQDIMTVDAAGKVAFPQGIVPRVWAITTLPTPDTAYTNTTKQDLILSYVYLSTGAAAGVTIDVNSVSAVAYSNCAAGGYGGVSVTVPAGGVWAVRVSGGPVTFTIANRLAGT